MTMPSHIEMRVALALVGAKKESRNIYYFFERNKIMFRNRYAKLINVLRDVDINSKKRQSSVKV